MRLAQKLKKWEKAGYITAEQRHQILSAEQKNSTSRAYQLFYWLAGLFIGLGSIFVISANWQGIPDMIKLLGDFALWGGLIYALTKTYNQRSNLIELFLTLSFLFTGASIGLIAQIYHLNGDWKSFTLLWGFLSFPFVLLSKLKPLHIVWFSLFLCGLPWDILIPNSLSLFVIITSLLLCLISLSSKKINIKLKKYTLLAESLADFSLFLNYFCVLLTGIIGRFEKGLDGYICLLYAFLFLSARLLTAYKQKEITSFTRNIYLFEIFILFVFLSQFGNLLSSGIGFILGGVFILCILKLFKKTSYHLKHLEFSK